jgi:hypothetical protein
MPTFTAPLPTTSPNAIAYTATFIALAASIAIVWAMLALTMFWWMPRRNAAFRRAEDQRLGFHLTVRPASDESWGNTGSNAWGHSNNNNIHIIELQTIAHAPEPAITAV